MAYKRGRREEIKLGKRKEGVNAQVHHIEGEEKMINKSDYGEAVLCPDLIQLMLGERSVVTSPNPWASSRSVDQSLKSQSYIYWSEPEGAPH